jgi:type I restriction enzyme S subunit
MKKVTKPTLFNLRFPLPPLPEQERIVTELDRLRTQARSARATAAASRESAAQAFHAALFAPV